MTRIQGWFTAVGMAAVFAATTFDASAYFAGGGKKPENDCLIGYQVDAETVIQDGKKYLVECTDCDPACDLDGVDTANGSCTFEVGVCTNQSGVEGCTPASGLDKAKVKVKGAKVVIDVAQLLQGSACGALLDLPVATKKNGKKPGKATFSLKAQVKPDGGKKRKDGDMLTYVCNPRPEGEACPSITTTTATTSTTTTTLPEFVCGDGMLEGPEECDDGNPDPTDGCTNACTVCGNGVVAPEETCDDGNLVSDDGCDANCQVTGCGNGLIVGAETCDDGNTDDADACPSDCIIDFCAPNTGTDYTVTVHFAGSNDVAGITVFLDYPEGLVNIPGSGANVPTGIITDLPGFAFGQTNDLDHALIQAVVDAEAFPAGQLFNIHFQTCADAPVPTAGQFACTVQAAGDANLMPIPGVTCSVTLP